MLLALFATAKLENRLISKLAAYPLRSKMHPFFRLICMHLKTDSFAIAHRNSCIYYAFIHARIHSEKCSCAFCRRVCMHAQNYVCAKAENLFFLLQAKCSQKCMHLRFGRFAGRPVSKLFRNDFKKFGWFFPTFNIIGKNVRLTGTLAKNWLRYTRVPKPGLTGNRGGRFLTSRILILVGV